jgi:hypothetical protein
MSIIISSGITIGPGIDIGGTGGGGDGRGGTGGGGEGGGGTGGGGASLYGYPVGTGQDSDPDKIGSGSAAGSAAEKRKTPYSGWVESKTNRTRTSSEAQLIMINLNSECLNNMLYESHRSSVYFLAEETARQRHRIKDIWLERWVNPCFCLLQHELEALVEKTKKELMMKMILLTVNIEFKILSYFYKKSIQNIKIFFWNTIKIFPRLINMN